MAIVWPALQVTMIEPVGKKAAFIQQAIATLGLRNAAVAQCRVEEFALRQAGAHVRPPDLILSRAFASLADFAHGVERIAGSRTCVAAMKGARPDDEIRALPAAWRVDAVRALTVPGLDARRHLILMSRNDPLDAHRPT
jgi:16S rRNA (guanine527-N7)-methyltransferase